MTDDAKAATWQTYQAAWAEHLSPAERQALLAGSITEDCVYTDPNVRCAGRAELLAHIEQLRQRMPQGAFQNYSFLAHHDQALAAWMLHDEQGAVRQPGTSYARFNEAGRLTLITGFFAPALPAAE